MTYTADQFGIYLALAIHGGTQVDFLDEDALLNSTVMADYKVVFVTQPNLPKAGIQQLAAWAKTGGRLVLSGGAAMADEYNTTETTLSSLTGCPMSPFPRRLLPAAAQQQGQFAQQQQVSTEQGPSPIPFAANGSIELGGVKHSLQMYGDVNGFTAMRAEGSKTLGHFDSGGASVVETQVGSGSIIQMAWMPGLSYLINGTQADRVPNPVTEFPAALREFLHGLVADSVAMAVSLEDSSGEAVVGVETVLMSSDAGAVVTVVNWGGVSLSAALSLTLDLAAAGFDPAGANLAEVTDASSGLHIKPSAPKDGTVTVQITATHANFIVFARKTRYALR